MSAGGAPTHWDFTLLPFAAVIRRLLDAVAPAAVAEVGADRGDFTRELLDWAADAGAEVIAIDPEPAPELLRLAESRPELNLVRKRSLEALGELAPAQAVILDGDHNYYTLSRELELIAGGPGLPLLMVHDLGWPHARRDTYYSPEQVPEQHRQPLAHDVLVAPGVAGVAAAGIRFEWAAEREGGERNGVLTAVEDFVAQRQGLRLAVLPAFFGLGVLWPQDAAWADRVAEVIEPWDSSPLLARLEQVRLTQIVDLVRSNRQQELLRGMLHSRAFALAERISRLRGRRGSPLSRERVRRALDDSR